MKDKIIKYLKTVVLGFITPVLIIVIGGVIIYRFTEPKPKLDVQYALIDTKPYRQDALGKLNFKYETDKTINRLEVEINSIGSADVRNIDVDIRSMIKKLFSTPIIIFHPTIIENRVNEKQFLSEHIYIQISDLPINSKLLLCVEGKTYFEDKDIKIEVIGSGKYWVPVQKEIKIKSKKKSFLNKFFGVLITSTNNLYANTEQDTTNKTEKTKNIGGIYIGGYDPFVLTQELFILLQRKSIISQNESNKIKNICQNTKVGFRIGGINILKFDEEVINLLIKKKYINKKEAENILERSKKVGGILINGYNIIQIKVELLNIMIQKKLITLSEA